MVGIYFGASFAHRIFSYRKNLPKSQFLADFVSFGQLWANFTALALAKSMPKLQLKSLNPITLKP
jgi:hypothetical protein